MTRRTRLESRLARRKEWADSASRKSTSAFSSAASIADQIPLGQPILAGHHSERHARRDQEKIRSRMNKGCELQAKAQHHSDKAAGLEAQLDRTIFSDDPDAIERLEARIAELHDHNTATGRLILPRWCEGDPAPNRGLVYRHLRRETQSVSDPGAQGGWVQVGWGIVVREGEPVARGDRDRAMSHRILAEWSQNPLGHLTIHERLDDTSGGGRKHGRLGRLLTDRFMSYDQWRSWILRDPNAQAYEIGPEEIIR